MKPEQRFRLAYRTFPLLTWTTGLVTGFAILFHLFGLTNDYIFGDDIWSRYSHTLSNFWDHATVSFYSPFYNLFLALSTKYTPLWGPWTHSPLMILYVLNVFLMFRWFRKKLKLELWLSTFGVALYITHPILTEGMYWLNGAHTFIGLFWLLAALNTFPEDSNRHQWWRWLVPGFCLLNMSTTSAVSYPGYFLLVGYFGFQFRKQPKVLMVWGIFFLLGWGHIFLRNDLLNGDMFRFTPQNNYSMATQLSVFHFAGSLAENLEYTNPLIVLQRHLPQGYMKPGIRHLGNLLHLLWLLPLWAFILFRKDSKGWEFFLYGIGAIGILMLVAPQSFSQRRVMTLAFVQTVGFVLYFHYAIHTLQIVRKTLFLALGLLVIGLNLSAKVTGEWYQWIAPKHWEQELSDIAASAKDPETPLVFLTHKEWKRRQVDRPMYAGGAFAGLGGIRKMLLFADVPSCVYEGHLDDVTEHEIWYAGFNNSPRLLFPFGIDPMTYHCPFVLQPMQEVKCYEWFASIFPAGGFKRITGIVHVPSSTLINPEAREEAKVREVSVQVRCKPE